MVRENLHGISIKGVNTGVIRKSNNFIALALKIKEPRNKESLFFMSVMELRDLLIALESRMHQKHKLDAAARLQYEQARDKVIKKMAENIPEILVDELKMPILIVGLTRWNLPIIKAKILPSY